MQFAGGRVTALFNLSMDFANFVYKKYLPYFFLVEKTTPDKVVNVQGSRG